MGRPSFWIVTMQQNWDDNYINALIATMVQASWEQIYRCINLCNVY